MKRRRGWSNPKWALTWHTHLRPLGNHAAHSLLRRDAIASEEGLPDPNRGDPALHPEVARKPEPAPVQASVPVHHDDLGLQLRPGRSEFGDQRLQVWHFSKRQEARDVPAVRDRTYLSERVAIGVSNRIEQKVGLNNRARE